MKTNISSFVAVLVCCTLFVSCHRQSPEDKLAARLAASKDFIESQKTMLEVAEEFKAYKKDPAFIAKYKGLDSIQQRDSVLKQLMRSDAYMNRMLKVAEDTKKVIAEFPELSKLPGDTRKKVYMKATAIVLASQHIH